MVAVQRGADRRVNSGASYIAFNRPCIVGSELHYVASTITQSNISGGGMYTAAAERILREIVGSASVPMLVTSCTAALEMSATLCDLGPGDEVIMPSFTFVSTAEAVVRTGATPVFVDIRPDTLNLDESLVAQAITDRTRAIWPIHYAGVAAEMDPLLELAARHDLLVVEDAAQALGSTYRGRPLGSIGHLGTISFHETKNLNCGEGGALCVNDAALVERAEIVRDKGTNRGKFGRGETDKYTWVDHGSSYGLSEILAAFLLGQLEHHELIRDRRGELWGRYDELLSPLAESEQVQLPTVPDHVESNAHIYYLLTANREERDALIAWLADAGVQAVFHYVPLHASPMGERVGRTDAPLPVTDRAGECLVRLPLYHELSLDDVERVATRVLGFYGRSEGATGP